MAPVSKTYSTSSSYYFICAFYVLSQFSFEKQLLKIGYFMNLGRKFISPNEITHGHQREFVMTHCLFSEICNSHVCLIKCEQCIDYCMICSALNTELQLELFILFVFAS